MSACSCKGENETIGLGSTSRNGKSQNHKADMAMFDMSSIV